MKMKKLLQTAVMVMVLCAPLACATLPQPLAEDATRASTLWPGLKLEDLQNGRKLYVQNCGACHALHLPSAYGNERWDRVMVRMQVKAKIDDRAASTILAYLKTFSKDWPAETGR
jgi:hypothetical protein